MGGKTTTYTSNTYTNGVKQTHTYVEACLAF